jgi:hypothetical protein
MGRYKKVLTVEMKVSETQLKIDLFFIGSHEKRPTLSS